MDLREFVSMSLTQIVQGVADSASAISELGGAVSPAFSSGAKQEHIGVSRDGTNTLVYAVDFDVALVASTNVGGEAGAKLQIASFVNIGGKASASDKQESTSRVRFSVPLQLPTDPKSVEASKEARRIQQEQLRAARVANKQRFAPARL